MRFYRILITYRVEPAFYCFKLFIKENIIDKCPGFGGSVGHFIQLVTEQRQDTACCIANVIELDVDYSSMRCSSCAAGRSA